MSKRGKSSEERELLTVQDVAKILGVSIRTVWRWEAEGKIPRAIRVNKITVRWRRSHLQHCLDTLASQAG